MLKILLFAPESPIITRASTGSVDASQAEKAIHTIDVWVLLESFQGMDDNGTIIHMHELFGNILSHPVTGASGND